MLQMIKSNEGIRPHLRKEIEDAGIAVAVDSSLSEEDYAAIKVDEFYNSLRQTITPKSIDFLVSVDCSCNAYVLYFLELKNINSPDHLAIKDVEEKFQNTINDFVSDRFADIFLNDRFKHKAVYLYLVSDMYGIGKLFSSVEEYKRYCRRDSLKADDSLRERLFRIRSKICRIQTVLPGEVVIQRSTL